MIHVSIIIPHYNSAPKLERLLGTIPPGQRWLQVIVVDDNSSDGDRLEAIKRNHPDVSFYRNHSGNKGPGASRNIGLSRAAGTWVLFADSDDFFVEGAFETLAKYLDCDDDIVYFAPTSIYEDSKEVAGRHVRYRKLIEDFLENGSPSIRYNYCAPWSKLIRRGFLEACEIRFDEIVIFDDVNFSVKAGFHATALQATRETIYCVTTSRDSLSHDLSEEAFDSKCDAKRRYNAFLRDRGLEAYCDDMLNLILLSRRYGVLKLIRVAAGFIRSGDPILPIRYSRFLASAKLALAGFLRKLLPGRLAE